MIEKIYIPTLHRIDNQVTYNNLPDSLKKKVVLVVQEWERDQYDYDVEYLVLPPEINKDDRYCLAKTRTLTLSPLIFSPCTPYSHTHSLEFTQPHTL